ncbi:TldD/PmbA family protein [Pyrococcus abyssi]|uniref:Tldd protein n=1 Tax=Pyrococcus abyssi (strain GE5 / Orsay) TaxID=272844 RepID=Q9V246_PYRAB|nr:TldD/PmbA family protein [Pyrococcus abyssi]CAB49152.1 tldD-like modulator of DNA gyrase, tldD protein homolog [Pyrococcus abyssi GE5]CCE69604.1 TPA: tldd protein [Pyrococcus abyssi GE5]
MIDELRNLIEKYSNEVKFMDIRFENTIYTEFTVENGKVEGVESNEEVGIGVRVLINGWGFASTNDLSKLEDTIKMAIKLAKVSNAEVPLYVGNPVEGKAIIKQKKDFLDVDLEEKTKLGLEVEKMIRRDKIKTSRFSYSDFVTRKIYLNSEGSVIETVVPRIYFSLSAVARSADIMQTYWKSFGGTVGWELVESVDFNYWANFISSKALSLLSARSPPSGEMPIIMDPELAGVFIHEALGHAVEADSVRQGESILSGMIGKKIGSEELTVIDDPTLPGKFGSYVYDDEGLPGKRVEIIKDGVLLNYLNDRETSKALNLVPNGHGRAQSYAHVPLVRMSNTYIAPGEWTLEEMFEEVKFGVYMIGDKGGQVDIANGSFMFGAKEGYIIKEGEIKEQVRDVGISGNILDTLKEIKAVGRDLKIEFPGFCGKGQWVPVDDGGPHVLVKAIVGGRE